jgi:hypothetical protein
VSTSRIFSRLVVLAMVAGLVAADVTALDAQCSMCRTLLETPEGERIAAGLRSGIWILLAAPVGAFAVIAVAAVRSRRRLQKLGSEN